MNPPMNRPKSGYGACARAEGDSPSAPPATKMSKSISQRLSGAAAIKAPRKTERLALIHSTQAAFSYYYVLVQHFLSKIIIFLQLRRQSPSIINMNYACDPLGSPRYIYGIPHGLPLELADHPTMPRRLINSSNPIALPSRNSTPLGPPFPRRPESGGFRSDSAPPPPSGCAPQNRRTHAAPGSSLSLSLKTLPFRLLAHLLRLRCSVSLLSRCASRPPQTGDRSTPGLSG